jgi:hypothetical protein
MKAMRESQTRVVRGEGFPSKVKSKVDDASFKRLLLIFPLSLDYMA